MVQLTRSRVPHVRQPPPALLMICDGSPISLGGLGKYAKLAAGILQQAHLAASSPAISVDMGNFSTVPAMVAARARSTMIQGALVVPSVSNVPAVVPPLHQSGQECKQQ